MNDDDASRVDIAVVGAGPAGLQAALKSALLFHSCVVLDKGQRTSRAFFVPNMDNVPGYPTGVTGRDIMRDQREQIQHAEEVAGEEFVTYHDRTEVTSLTRLDDDAFRLTGHEVEGRDGVGEEVVVEADAVVLATGVVDRQPYIGEEGYDISAILPYANKGLADYCLLCDGHTIKGQSVVVLGLDEHALGIAEALRDHFHAEEVVLAMCIPCATGAEEHGDVEHDALLQDAEARGIPVREGTIAEVHGLDEDRIELVFHDGSTEAFDKAWISLGWFDVRNDLALQAGAQVNDEGYVESTEDCEVLGPGGDPIEGLFVAGDLRAETWNQVPVGMGDAETAVITAYAFRLD